MSSRHHFNELTPAEAERLALLAEECGEVIQAIGKVLRHGYESCHPDAVSADFDNRFELEKELGDVLAAIKLMQNGGDICEERVIDRSIEKLDKVGRFLHHQERAALKASAGEKEKM